MPGPGRKSVQGVQGCCWIQASFKHIPAIPQQDAVPPALGA